MDLQVAKGHANKVMLNPTNLEPKPRNTVVGINPEIVIGLAAFKRILGYWGNIRVMLG